MPVTYRLRRGRRYSLGAGGTLREYAKGIGDYTKQAQAGADAAERALGTLISALEPSEVDAVLTSAEKVVQPLAVKYLEANYNNSGVVTRTGKLLGAIRDSFIKIKGRGRNLWIFAHMAPNVNKYESPKQKNTHFYNAAAAVNYGGVYNSGAGKRVKRGIKEKTFGGKNPPEHYRLAKGGLGKSYYARYWKGQKTSAEVYGYSATGVIRATEGKDYYKLTERQLADLTFEVMDYFMKALKAIVSRRKGEL